MTIHALRAAIYDRWANGMKSSDICGPYTGGYIARCPPGITRWVMSAILSMS